MDQFENTVPEAEDPAAEFLAREENAFANLENDENDQSDDDILENNNHHDDVNESIENFDMINSNDENHHDIDKIVQPREESEKIRKWREEQKDMLQKKDEEEEIKKHELKQQAKAELDDWYKNHKESISKIKATNRNADKEYNIEVEQVDEPGMQWERIAKLCDFNAKTNKTKDVSRMRSIILQLKQNE